MSKVLTYLALPPDLSGPWAFMDMHEGGSGQKMGWARTEAEKQSLSEKELTVILPGENIRRAALDLPGIRGRELQSAIEFDLEDRLGGALSGEIICQDRKNPGHVAIIDKQYKDQLSDIFAQFQFSPDQILIDYELIGEGMSLSVGERLLKGGVNGFAAHKSWEALMSDPPAFTAVEPEGLFGRFHEAISGGDAELLNLRAGLGLKSARAFDWQPWTKLAALILAVTVLPFMFDKYSGSRAAAQQAKQDRTAAQDIYEAATGERATDPARLLPQRLKTGQKTAGFMDMSAVLFAALSDVEGAEIEAMRYNPRDNILQLSIRYPNFEAGEQLEQAANQRGGQLALGGIRERGEALIGEASFVLARGGR